MNVKACSALIWAALTTMMALLSWGMAAAPGCRRRRSVSWSASSAARHALSDLPLPVPVSDALLVVAKARAIQLLTVPRRSR